MTTALTAIHWLSCILLIGIVLIQPGREDGMAGAFGGMGGSVTFGVKTQNVLWKATILLASLFMLSALGMVFLERDQTVKAPEGFAAPAAPAPAPAP